MSTNCCHNEQCRSTTLHARCSQCIKALYCSRECQQRHWEQDHGLQCRPHSWLQLGAGYVVTSSGGGSTTTPTTTTTTQGGAQEHHTTATTFDTLRDKFKQLAALDYANIAESTSGGAQASSGGDEWLFVSDFFASMRVNLQAMLDNVRVLLEDNAHELDIALTTWAASRSERVDQQQQAPPTEANTPEGANVVKTRGGGGLSGERLADRWKRITSALNYGELTKIDKEVELLLERGKTYRALGGHCRQLLGLKRSTVAQRDRVISQNNALNLELVFYDDEPKGTGSSSHTRLPPLSWNQGLSESIYLYLDWDDVTNTQLDWTMSNTVTSVAFRTPSGSRSKQRTLNLPNESNKLLFRAATEARLQWLQRLSEVFRELDAMVGMDDIKEQLARFVLQQIVFQASPILSGTYVNFVIGGNPGTGKTEIAKKFPALLYLLGLLPTPPRPVPRITTRSDWIGEYEGHTAAKTRALLVESLGELVIIDEAYSLFSPPKDTYGMEFINQLVNDMSLYRGLLSVMLLGYQERIERNILKSNEGLNRRFNNKWRIQNYSARELFIILCHKLVEQEYGMPGLDSNNKNEATISREEQRDVFRLLAAALPLSMPSATTASISMTHPEFKPSLQELDQYDSVFNILQRLHESNAFVDSNAGVIPILISQYNATVVTELITGDIVGGDSRRDTESTADRVSVFDQKYVTLRKGDVKKLNLPIFIRTLIAFAVQRGIIVVKEG